MSDQQSPNFEPDPGQATTSDRDRSSVTTDGKDSAESTPMADTLAADAPPTEHGDEQDGRATAAESTVDFESLAVEDPRSRAELLEALLGAESARDEYLDDLRRSRAEFENYRRRVMREGAAQRDAGKADAVTSLLEVLDDLDRTLAASQASDDVSLAKGVQLVASNLVAALESHGLSRIDQVDTPFDPNEHEAVQQQPSEAPVEQPTVVEVLRPGYRLGDRVLRPAMVAVAT